MYYEHNAVFAQRLTGRGFNSQPVRFHVAWVTQPCIPLGSLYRVPASLEIKARLSPLPGGR